MKKKGFIFTLAVVMLIVPLILLVEFYTTSSKTKSEDMIGKIRCDEVYYFVEDVDRDIGRAMGIFGRRAAIYAIDHVVTEGEALNTYSFNCTSSCGVDCNLFKHEVNGSGAAIAELTMCGTLMGGSISYMENHTLSKWMERMTIEGDTLYLNVTMEVNNITVLMHDAWSMAMVTSIELEVADQQNVCFYKGTHEITALTSILGLEDVLYPLNTNAQVIKFIENCTNDNLTSEVIAGCSLEWLGNGTVSGYAVFYSDIPEGEMGSYCSDHTDINQQILVMDTAFGAAPCNKFEDDCFNISSDIHFAGAVNYDVNRVTPFVEKCNLTIPWITGTGDMDNRTPQNPGWDRNESCTMGAFSNQTCITIKNLEPCRHDILVGLTGDDVNTSCYIISNVTSYPCSTAYNGPSFLDRLDGRYNLSEFHMNQSRDYFNNTMIGIESIINPYELSQKGIAPKENASWIDYMYWRNITGCGVLRACGTGAYELKVDCVHAYSYELDTECNTIEECPSESEISSSSSSSTSSSSSSTSSSSSSSFVSTSSSSSSSSWISSSSSSSSSSTATTTTTMIVIATPPQDCDAAVQESSANSFPDSCDGSYPGVCGNSYDRLSCDDGKWENHEANSNQYCGVKALYYNSSVGDCNSIEKVEVCYEWYITASSPSDCDISVSADGSSWSETDTTCYTSWPGVQCVDVTSAFSWTCNDFFTSNGAYLRQNAESNQDNKRCRIDVLYYSVSYS